MLYKSLAVFNYENDCLTEGTELFNDSLECSQAVLVHVLEDLFLAPAEEMFVVLSHRNDQFSRKNLDTFYSICAYPNKSTFDQRSLVDVVHHVVDNSCFANAMLPPDRVNLVERRHQFLE